MLDPVYGRRDGKIAGDYLRAGEARVAVIAVTKEGSWRHAIGKYPGQGQLRRRLRSVFE